MMIDIKDPQRRFLYNYLVICTEFDRLSIPYPSYRFLQPVKIKETGECGTIRGMCLYIKNYGEYPSIWYWGYDILTDSGEWHKMLSEDEFEEV